MPLALIHRIEFCSHKLLKNCINAQNNPDRINSFDTKTEAKIDTAVVTVIITNIIVSCSLKYLFRTGMTTRRPNIPTI